MTNNRHGDVISCACNLDFEITGVKVESKILAYGEVTGHSHRVVGENTEVFIFDRKLHDKILQNIRAKMLEEAPVRDQIVLDMINSLQLSHIVRVNDEKATLVHEEHKKQTLTRGIHGVFIQKSFRGKSWRAVLD